MKEEYENNKDKYLKILYELGYTPHDIAVDAYNEGMSIYEYIVTLCT